MVQPQGQTESVEEVIPCERRLRDLQAAADHLAAAGGRSCVLVARVDGVIMRMRLRGQSPCCGRS